MQSWDHQNEDWQALAETSPIPDAVYKFDVPESVDPRSLLKVENQGPVGSCRGHSLSTAIEWCYYVATRKVKQFSRAFAYYGCQKLAGTLGRDQGATIHHGRTLATKHGLPPESYWPYVARYNPQPPSGWGDAFDAADPYKIKKAYGVDSVEAIHSAIGSGQGFVDLGILWGGVSVNHDGIMTKWAPRGGGHAVCLCGYLPKSETYRGERLYILANSHGERFGKGGFAFVPANIVDVWCGHNYSAMQVLTDLTTPEPRKIDWESVV